MQSVDYLLYICPAIIKIVKMSNSKPNILFLINPKSGVGSKRSIVRYINTLTNKQKYNVSIKETQYVAHATELAKEAVQSGVEVVVAVGGDGTVNEVARSLAGSKTALGIIPCGSGNGLARHLGIPIEIKKAIEFLNTAEPCAVDYGKINGVPFFCTCGIGFDAFVSSSFAQGTRRGLLGYMNQTLVDWLNYKPEVYEIEGESFKKKYKAFLIACGNAAQYGNNAYISPNASMRDGLLGITILEQFSAAEIPFIISDLFGCSLTKNAHIKTLETKWLRIRRKTAGPVHYDGEPTDMEAEIFVETVPQGLNIMAAPGWDGLSVAVPMYKQIFDMINGSLPEVDIEFPKIDITLPGVNLFKNRMAQMPPLSSMMKFDKRKKRNNS